jgi:hypothetical protein
VKPGVNRVGVHPQPKIIHNWLPMDDVLVSVGSFFVATEIIFPSSKHILEMICLINSSESLSHKGW